MSGRFVPFKSAHFTHGGSDFDLTDPTNKLAPGAHGFMPTSTGNLVFRLAGDSADRTWPVTSGTPVLGNFVVARSTSTADGDFFQTM